MVRLFFLLSLLSVIKLNAQKNDQKPNFLFILVDDQPYDAVGFSNRYPFLKTPNIDKLASESVNIKNFFVTQSICSPSRASFLTGTYPHIHGVIKTINMLTPIGNHLHLIQSIYNKMDIKQLILERYIWHIREKKNT